jgi:hypothetical protein
MHCDPTRLSVHFRISMFLISQSSEFGTSRKLGPHCSEFGTMIPHRLVLIGAGLATFYGRCTSLLSGATYAGGGWLPWLSASSVEMLNQAQNHNLRIITGQLASTPTDALRVEAEFQSFGCLQDRAASAALERSLRLDPATHPRAV